jgi:hypothetical protein
MLELSGFASGTIPLFLSPTQIEKIKAETGRLPASHETAAERAWRQYLELTESINRQLFQVNRAIDKALVKSERRVRAAQEDLQRIQDRATVDGKGRWVYRT